MEKVCERHNLPHTITLFGHEVQVEIVDGLGEDEDGKKDWGQADMTGCPLQIRIHSCCDGRRAYQTLVHEVIEMVNNEMELGLEHPNITRLELGLTDFLLNNNIDWGYVNGIRY